MSDTVIQVENLGKKYIIGHQQQERYTALRDVIANGAKSLGQRLLKPWGKQSANPAYEEFWALKDVSFEVKQGDRIGIIGRNGAGKSTLLKILSRITEPTTGKIRIKGRVASLLEVGTGFHPELTGRENIYLNGAILGMSKTEIKRKFDEIVDFAGIEKFLDTPVKRYSSGMYVRLAFAVAAHLEPEILIVDEVLAVGDAQFQKKCLGKMEEVGREGRTVVFVSHNMAAITNLCQTSIFLEGGQIKFKGWASDIVGKYLESTIKEFGGELCFYENNSEAYFTKVSLLNEFNQPTEVVKLTEKFTIRFEYDTLKKIENLEISFSLFDRQGAKIFNSGTPRKSLKSKYICQAGHYISEVKIPPNFLAPGLYTITIGLYQPNVYVFDKKENIIIFSVVDSKSLDTFYKGKDIGSILVDFEWSTNLVD